MLDFMERITIKVLKKKGYTNTAIAAALGRDRKTVSKALDASVDESYHRSPMGSKVDEYSRLITVWIVHKIPVKRMLELARSLDDNPYQGGKSVFYEKVRQIRQDVEKQSKDSLVCFDSLPAEYLQVDWGETKIDFGSGPVKRYFLCCRLKFSRFMFVEFHDNMRFETLIRSLLRCFVKLNGVPWQLVFDNMKTVTVGRDSRNQPILNPRFKKFCAEFDFGPILCAPRAGNQKGSVENLVKFVKSNFLTARTFHDDADLGREVGHWLDRVNSEKSQAHGRIPNELLKTEQGKLTVLPENARDYGVLELLSVNPESMILYETNSYSVPELYMGDFVTVRIHENHVRIYDKAEKIAEHERCFKKGKRIRELAHFENAFKKKPRAKIMVVREKLLELGEEVYKLVEVISRRRKDRMGPEILKLWELKETNDLEDFLIAVGMALEEGLCTSEYVEAFLKIPNPRKRIPVLDYEGEPEQKDVDRNLSSYERFVKGEEL